MVFKHDLRYRRPPGMLRLRGVVLSFVRCGGALYSCEASSGVYAKAIQFYYERAETGWNLFTGWRGVPKQLPVGPAAPADKELRCLKSSLRLELDDIPAKAMFQVGTCSAEGTWSYLVRRVHRVWCFFNTSAVLKQGGTCFEEERVRCLAKPPRLYNRLELVQREKFLKYHEDVWELLRQFFLRAGRTRLCHSRICWPHSVMTNFGCQKQFGTLKEVPLGISDHKVEALREDGDTASQSTACLQEDLASSADDRWKEEPSDSDDDSLTWDDLASMGPQARGESARYAVSNKTRTSREKLRRKMRRRKRCGGSGVTGPNMRSSHLSHYRRRGMGDFPWNSRCSAAPAVLVR
eukprot:3381676-Amphidinium_carterae.1